jgi:hypothetical protein
MPPSSWPKIKPSNLQAGSHKFTCFFLLLALLYKPKEGENMFLRNLCKLLPDCTESNINKTFWEELIAYFPWYDTGHIENDASNNSSIVACIFVTEPLASNDTRIFIVPFPSNNKGIFQSHCLATIRWLLRSRRLATVRGIHRHKHKNTHTRTATWSHKPNLFFQNGNVG